MSPVNTPGKVLEGVALEHFATVLASSSQRWRKIAGGADEVGRAYALIWEDEHVNAWAIRWCDDADTGFHDHDGSAAGIVVIEGSVVEERLSLAGAPIARCFSAGQSFQMPPSAIHRVRHGGGVPAWTVHAYSPPLQIQGVYRVADDGALVRETVPYTEELRGELAAA